MDIFKRVANILTKPTAEICSISISSGLFLSDCKIGKFRPLYKKRSKANLENFRPIFLFPWISKISGRIVYDQIDHLLLQSNTLCNYQAGFKKNHSTDFYLSFLNDKILNGFDKGPFMGMIFIYLQNAFDAIDHEILLGVNYMLLVSLRRQ